MRKVGYILGAINSVIGIIVGIHYFSNNATDILGFPIGGWLLAIYVIFAIIIISLVLTDKSYKNEIQENVSSEVAKQINDINKLSGTLESVSPEDRNFIYHYNMEMRFQHGHSDPYGLAADRASGVPLNELMSKNCSRCGEPRNKKSSINLDEDWDYNEK
jgi:hypothetical protein